MSYQVESDVKLVFKDGQCFTMLSGKWIDLFKLDNVAEIRTVLLAIASETVSSPVKGASMPSAEPVVQTGPDLDGYAEQIRKSFQDQADKAQERLEKLTNPNESPTKV